MNKGNCYRLICYDSEKGFWAGESPIRRLTVNDFQSIPRKGEKIRLNKIGNTDYFSDIENMVRADSPDLYTVHDVSHIVSSRNEETAIQSPPIVRCIRVTIPNQQNPAVVKAAKSVSDQYYIPKVPFLGR